MVLQICTIFLQYLSQHLSIYIPNRGAVLNRQSSGSSGGLTHAHAGGHHPDCACGGRIGADTATGDQQLLHTLGKQAAVRNTVIVALDGNILITGGAESAVNIHRVGGQQNAVLRYFGIQQVVGSESVVALNMAAFPNTDVGCRGLDSGILTSGYVLAKEVQDVLCLLTSHNLGTGQALIVGAVHTHDTGGIDAPFIGLGHPEQTDGYTL